MGEVKKKAVGSMQKGHYIVIDGAACIVQGLQTSRPGKHGHAKVRLQAVGMIDEKKREIVLPGHDEVDVPVIEKKNAQVLSVHDDTVNVMDMETYETFDLKIPEELKGEVVDGAIVLYWEILTDRVLKQVTQKQVQ